MSEMPRVATPRHCTTCLTLLFLLLLIQVPGVSYLQEHIGRAGLLRHCGNTGHQV